MQAGRRSAAAYSRRWRQHEHEKSDLQRYAARGKPVLDAEYEPRLFPTFCSADGIMGARFNIALDGFVPQPYRTLASG